MNKKILVPLAILVLCGVAIISYYVGNTRQRSENVIPSTDSVPTKVTSKSELKDNPVSSNEQEVAVSSDLSFSFPDYPGISFKINSIKKVYDPKADYNQFSNGIYKPALLSIDILISNNSDKKINANYIQIVYTDSSGQTRVAPYYIHTSYEVAPLSVMHVVPTIIIPENQTQVSLVTGIYPPIIYDTAEDLLSRSNDAFIIDFKQNKAWHPEG